MPAHVKKLSSQAALDEHVTRNQRFDFLRQRLLKIEVEEVWAKLEADLTLGDGRANPDRIARALDEAEANLRRAGMLLQVAIEEADEFEVHYRAAYLEWSWQARESLEKAKRDKKLSGQTTQELVEDWVAAHVAAYGKWREARRALERNRNLAKQMYAAWESRSASLRKQADLVERRTGVSPELLDRRNRRRERDDDANQ
jgi:hypothetical protein